MAISLLVSIEKPKKIVQSYGTEAILRFETILNNMDEKKTRICYKPMI